MLMLIVRTNAPWGLQRISQAAKLSSTNAAYVSLPMPAPHSSSPTLRSALTYTFPYDDSAGQGVDIYIVGE